jgi:hypothetical protein
MPHFKPPDIEIFSMSFKVASDLRTTCGSTLSLILGRKGIGSLPGRLSLPMAGSHHVSLAQLPTRLLGRPNLQWLPSINSSVLKGSIAR